MNTAPTIRKMIAKALSISILARFAQLGMAIFAARSFGPEGYGVFTYAMGIGLVAGRLGGLGWPMVMARFVPTYVQTGEWGLLRGLLRIGPVAALISSMAVAALMVFTALMVGRESGLYLGLLLGALIMPMMSLRTVYRRSLASFDRSGWGIAIDELIPPLVVALGILSTLASGPQTALYIYAAASFGGIAIGIWLVRQAMPAQARSATPQVHLKMWLITGLPALAGLMAKLLMNKSDVLMLAPLAGMEAVGFYGAAMRVTFVQLFPMIALSTVLTPRISAAIAAGQHMKLKRMMRLGIGAALLVSVPASAALIFFAAPIMSFIYGTDFQPGAPVLAVLSAGQIAAAISAITSSFLIVSGLQMRFAYLTMIALGVNLALNFALIPLYGGLGAAIATSVSATLLVTCELLLWFGYRRRL